MSAGPAQRWRRRAACRGVDPELFHPFRGESMTEALAICERCPVRTDCLEHALATPERVGIWGGTSERQRRVLRRQRRLGALEHAS